LTQEGLDDEKQNSVRQLLDKKLWADALEVAREAGVSKNGLVTLESLFETKGEDIFQVLSQIRDRIQGYASALAAVDNLWRILELIKDSGEELEVVVEAGFARGLEYYTGMIFESYVPGIDIALGGGGRYDKLIELFGGEPISAVGVAQGIDRIVLALTKQNVAQETANENSVAVISVKDDCMAKVLELSATLRNLGLHVEVAVMGRSISRALTDANRRGVAYAVIVGPNELKEEKVVLREMKKSLAQEILAGSS